MPRHTHPRPKSKHSRAHVREQRVRKFESRWKRAKLLHRHSTWSYGAMPPSIHPEQVRAVAADVRESHRTPWAKRAERHTFYIDGWPFYEPANRFIDNMVDRRACSCFWCTPAADPGRRTREERRWREVEAIAW